MNENVIMVGLNIHSGEFKGIKYDNVELVMLEPVKNGCGYILRDDGTHVRIPPFHLQGGQ